MVWVFSFNIFHGKRADLDALFYSPCAGRGTGVTALLWEHSDSSGRTHCGSPVLGQVRLPIPAAPTPFSSPAASGTPPCPPERLPFLQGWVGTRWEIPAAFRIPMPALRNSTENPALTPGPSRNSRGSGESQAMHQTSPETLDTLCPQLSPSDFGCVPGKAFGIQIPGQNTKKFNETLEPLPEPKGGLWEGWRRNFCNDKQ